MATVQYFWHSFIHRSATFVYLQYSRLLIYHVLPNVWKASYTINTSIFVEVPYWPPIALISSSLVSYRVPRSGEEIVIAWTHIGWVRWMFHNLPLPAAQEVRDSSGVTPCIVLKIDGVLYHQVSMFSPESMRLQSLPQSKRTTARDMVQHKRRTIGRSTRNINKHGRTDGVRRLHNI